ncbi:MAG: hypothetical protein O2822_07455 [Chloroflexi bacterium]|nr:hypothetical protein [Chloroflexota bacterium]
MIADQPTSGSPAPVRLTAGLIAFIAFMVAPAIIATAIVLTAWVVSDEVYAAERAAASGSASAEPVAEWKTTVVGICPIH